MNQPEFLCELDDLFDEEPGSVTPSTQFRDLAAWDSLTFLGLIALVDEQYGITLVPETVLACTTIGDLVAVVQGQCERKEKAA